mmetsp:Transcript_777/g.1934  ORF Transcript_777/g.1934 Transcript_777/m.1934 type:complete len:580 (+) Transcript_777:999-2738(+)
MLRDGGVDDQRRVAAQLAQVLQRLEHVRRGRLARWRREPLADLARHRAGSKLLVQRHLQRRHGAVHVLDDLGRQVAQHLVLGAAEHKGHDGAVQRVRGQQPLLRLAAALLGRLGHLHSAPKLGVELPLCAKEAGHEVVKDAPQLQHVVLDGRSGQEQPVPGDEPLDGLGDLGLGVLDDVPLVQDDVQPAGRLQPGDVRAAGLVAHDDDVVAAGLPRLAQGGARGGGALVAQRAEHAVLAQEALDLRCPVPHQRGGAGDQGGQPQLAAFALLHALVCGGGGDGDGLQRLAQPHVVRQHAVQPEFAQEGEPVDALLLVRAQRDAQCHSLRQHKVRGALVVQQLVQQRAVLLPGGQLLGAEPRGGRQPLRQRQQLHQQRKARGRRLPDRRQRVRHPPQQRHQQEHRVGRHGAAQPAHQLRKRGGAAQAGHVAGGRQQRHHQAEQLWHHPRGVRLGERRERTRGAGAHGVVGVLAACRSGGQQRHALGPERFVHGGPDDREDLQVVHQRLRVAGAPRQQRACHALPQLGQRLQQAAAKVAGEGPQRGLRSGAGNGLRGERGVPGGRGPIGIRQRLRVLRLLWR